MADFLATLSPKYPGNWEICKREGLWGVVGRGTNWRKNALKVKPGDQVFIWRSGDGIIAQIEALGTLELAGPGVHIPWPDPDWFGGVFPMRVVAELAKPAGDSFPNANGRVGLRFGFNNSALQHIFEEILPDVSARISSAFPGVPTSTGAGLVGIPYLAPPPPASTARADPFERDPDLVDRGLLAHHLTVEKLVQWVRDHGLDPRSPGPSEPQFDLGWRDGATVFVAEVKSLTPANEEKQLRLGLGQVLRYRHQLGGTDVEAWLVAEREPADPSWMATCDDSGVTLLWPDALP